MKFLVVSHVIHKSHDNQVWGYGPYIREMNLWEKHIDELVVIAPIESKVPNVIDLPYISRRIHFIKVPAFNVVGFTNKVKTILLLPSIFWRVFLAMKSADHIHLRCPGNMGLIGAFVQIFYPRKKKTAKYAGNWDPKMNKIRSYNLQRIILSSTFLTKNIQVLVYGNWPNTTNNITPFFTASYSQNEIKNIPVRNLNTTIKCIYCGFLSKEKRPIKSVMAVEKLNKMGIDIELTLLGDGLEYNIIKEYIRLNKLEKFIILKGNVNAFEVKKHMQNSHFLTFYGHDSEGWPKVVAESMFWGCVPLVRSVSCTEYMLGYGERGTIVKDSVSSMVDGILFYLNNPVIYQDASENCMKFSRQFTLEKFEESIVKLLKP